MVLVSLLVLFVILVAAGFFFSNVVIHPKVRELQETFDSEAEEGKIVKAVYETWEKEPVEIQSPYDYKLRGIFFPLGASRKTVILCHGITFSMYGSVKYMGIFRDAGFNILIYDHRGHGSSDGKNTTFGYYEKHDLKAVADWVFAKMGADTIVGIHGESMGAAIALQYSALDDRIRFVIEDCGYSDLVRLLTYRMRREYKLPWFPLIPMASLISALRIGFNFHYVSPEKAIATVKIPMLFIHGADDDYIPPSMCQELYDAKQGVKEIFIAPNAKHAEAYWNNQETYRQIVTAFLTRNGFL